jgi:hypothetical protein
MFIFDVGDDDDDDDKGVTGAIVGYFGHLKEKKSIQNGFMKRKKRRTVPRMSKP